MTCNTVAMDNTDKKTPPIEDPHFADHDAFPAVDSNQHSQSTPTSHTVYPSSSTTAPSKSGLASPPDYSAHMANPTNDSPQSYPSLEDSSCCAAREDRRRRNTAASGRFRVKKKQREQALERSVKGLQDNIVRLEANLVQLEIENKWLKDLATQKMEKRGYVTAGSKEGVEMSDDQKHSECRDGVGA